MMKTKRVLIGLVLAASVFSVSAQENPSSEVQSTPSKAKDNWFISIGAGPNVLIGEQDHKASWGDRIKFGGELSVGKWFNPNFGMRLQFSGNSFSGFNYTDNQGGVYTRSDRSRAQQPIGYPDKLNYTEDSNGQAGFWQDFGALSGTVDLMANLTNLFRGYYRDHAPVEVLPFVGLGYQHGFESDTNPEYRGFVGKIGARVNFNLNNKFAIYLEPQLSMTSSEFDGYVGNRDFDNYANLFAGVHFNINKNFALPGSLSQEEVNLLNQRINQQRNMIDNQQEILERQQQLLNELKNGKDNKQPIAPDAPEVRYNNNSKKYLPDYIRFGLNSSSIELSEKHKVEDAADYLKANPGSKLLMIGYADKKTGNHKYNYQLSCKRVEAIAQQLKAMGIDSSRLIIQCVGDKEQPYDQNEWNRVVIMVERK